jgi:hypothetical protein
VFTYSVGDVSDVVWSLQYLRYAKEGNAKLFLRRLATDSTELAHILARYPQVRYAGLDYHYLLLKYLAVLKPPLVADLCSRHQGWRGVVTAAWLTCIKPSTDLVSPLLPWATMAPEPNKWLVGLALARATGNTWSGDPEIPRLFDQIQTALAPIPLPKFSLSAYPPPAKLSRMRAEMCMVRRAYRVGGLAAARSVLQDTYLGRFYGFPRDP